MKISITHLALLGLSCAQLRISGRAPQGPEPPSKQILDAIKDGMKDWGPAGSLKPPKDGPKAPIKNMIGGLPELHNPKPGSSDWREDTLKGPRKKPGKTYPNSNPCSKRDVACDFGPSSSNSPSDKGKVKGKGKVGASVLNIQGGKFLDFFSELDPEAFGPLIKAIEDGEITVADIEMALKRAISETMKQRWADFGSTEKAAETLKNIAFDIFATARYATPPGFWHDVVKNLPPIAKEIHNAKTPEEKLEIANKNINEVVTIWSYTPVGAFNENIMKEVAKGTPTTTAVAVSVNKLWSYTPLGWLINQIAPIDSWIRGDDGQVAEPKPKKRPDPPKKNLKPPVATWGKCKCILSRPPARGDKCANTCRAVRALGGWK
ncbi:Transcription elongation factor A [Metarhizium brunneum]